MAKQKDLGDSLEIYFDKDRDSVKKFLKLIRNAVTHERKDLFIDMSSAPILPSDYLASLVFGAQALKSHGYKVTFALSPQNYTLLKNSEHSAPFHFEIAQVVTDEEMAEAASEQSPQPIDKNRLFTLEGNIIYVEDEGADEIPQKLPVFIRSLLSQGYREIILDLTRVYLLTPSVIQTLILETLASRNALRVIVQESMKEVLESNPQAMVLNIVVKEAAERQEQRPLVSEAKIVGIDFGPAEEEDSQLEEESEQIEEIEEDSEETETEKHQEQVCPVAEEPSAPKQAEEMPPDIPSEALFKIRVNCLYVAKMPVDRFREEFPRHFQRLFPCGNKLCIDLSEFGDIAPEVAMQLFTVHIEAMAQNKEVRIQMLKPQREKMLTYFPLVEEVEDRKDTTPKFSIVGSRMELYNVTSEIFIEQFPQHFKKLLASGQNKVVVDISHLYEFGTREVEMLVLSYLEAVGRGLTVTLRIRPEMEENFLKSGRGRMLPLEIVRPEVSGKVSSSFEGAAKALDMGKIKDAIDKDRLTDKVLQKEFAAVHIESRGTVHNWEPSPTKASEKVAEYRGPERRKEKRYPAKNIEVAFAKGTLGKITGRHYPMHNLSNSGACFITAVSVSRSEPVRLKIFAAEDLSVEISAKVVWSSPIPSQALFRVGVQFTNLSEVVKMRLKEIIARIYQGG